MTFAQFSRWVWTTLTQIMNIQIPIFEYKITLWNLFAFFVVGSVISYIIWSLLTPRRA